MLLPLQRTTIPSPGHDPRIEPRVELGRKFGLDWESPTLAHRTKIRRAHYRTLSHRRLPQAALTENVGIGLHERHQSHLQWLLIQYVAWAAGSDAALLVQIMFYYRVFAPLRDPIIDQLKARTSDHVAAPR